VEFAEEPAGWAEADGWMAEALAADPAAAVEWILLDPRWGRGQELLALGMRREASRELSALLEDASGDAAALYELARAFEVIGMTDLSARATARLLARLPSEVAATAPREVLRLAYPVDYTGPLLEVAEAEEVPPLLFLALIRQESFFDPLAGSSAGALGLTQVIPPTAEEIAESLGVGDFETDDLFRPVVSLRFGASYLSDQMDRFEGNMYQALAAYNGGPGNALRWRDASGGDVDLFVEEIDLGESALFVRLVMEHLAWYRQVYEGLEGPALPAAVLELD
jgi:soluble lytic murein transglycosylase